GSTAFGLFDHQELIVRLLLHLDEVRHLGHFVDLAEHLPETLVTIRSSLLRHLVLLGSWPTLRGSSRRLTGDSARGQAEAQAKRHRQIVMGLGARGEPS